jgi:hypothetical protein
MPWIDERDSKVVAGSSLELQTLGSYRLRSTGRQLYVRNAAAALFILSFVKH